MRDLFPGFYQRTDEELSKLWQEGVFVFDTNMLLNVYRYTQKTRDRYFEILVLLKKRNQLWIPYQVAYEYQDRRIDVIQGQLDAYSEVSNILQATWQRLESSLEPYKRKHGFIDADKLAEGLTSAIKNAKATVTQDREKDKREYEALKKDDTLLETLERLFQGKIGNSYSKSRLEEIYRQAQLRIELRIPPGWEDEGKNNFKAYGDIILWFQLIDYARTQKKPIIFVTDDGKKDWWIRDSKGKPIKPLPALVQEVFVEAGVLLHMYRGYEFLEQATNFLNLTPEPGINQDAKEVSERNALEAEQKRRRAIPDHSWERRASFAVREWLEAQFPEAEIDQPIGSDFWIREPNGEVTDVILKWYIEPIPPIIVSDLLWSYFRGARGIPTDKQLLFLVFSTLDTAGLVARDVSEEIVIPPMRSPNLSVVIGYLSEDVRFRYVSVLGSSFQPIDKVKS